MDLVLPEYCKMDERIKYFGVVPNDKVIEAQLKATLLVNPRPSNVEFVKYSFPSKNMEYMASGTPMVTTALPGMPDEYYNYVFIFSEETIEGFATTLKRILALSEETLQWKGEKCKSFVMEKKNNIIQTKKVLNLFRRI
jgi:glycosyltransferase involved in cell wall biosynthesis